MRRAAAALVLFAIACLAATAARADATRAREHFELAKRYFQVDEYRKAIEEFKAAHIEEPDPAFLYNIAECHRHLGETKEALTFYRRFLSLSPPSAPSRAIAEKRIAEIEGKGTPVAPPATPAPTATPAPAAPNPAPAARPAPLPAAATPPEAAAPAPALFVSSTPQDASSAPDTTTPIYKRGWFYGVLGAVLIAGGVGIWAASARGTDVPGTPLGNRGVFQ